MKLTATVPFDADSLTSDQFTCPVCKQSRWKNTQRMVHTQDGTFVCASCVVREWSETGRAHLLSKFTATVDTDNLSGIPSGHYSMTSKAMPLY
jgi:transcription elongation factor Elf1